MTSKSGPSYVEQYRGLWFSGMLLLGFKPTACEEKFKVAFHDDMFSHINKKGSEVGLHFLFSTLDTVMAKERFRDCWPIYDKRQEQDFRKMCVSWLGSIAKDYPETKLPRLCSSLLLSPGGDKYYVFLYRLSKYVMRTVTLGVAEHDGLFVSSFLKTGSVPPAHREVAMEAMKAHVVRNCRQVLERLKLQSELHSEWERRTSQLVKEYQSTSKEVRQLKKQLNAVREEHKLRAVVGPPNRSSRSSVDERVLTLSAEVAEKQRATRMEKTRALWRCVESFDNQSRHQREVVDSVLMGEQDKYMVDAKDINFQVPEMLMADYESMVQSGQADNLYQDGKLNLISLSKLYNCALRKLQDCIAANKISSFEMEGQNMTEKLQMQRTLLVAVNDLGARLSVLQNSLQTCIDQQEGKLTDTIRKLSVSGEATGTIFTNGQAPILTLSPIEIPTLGLGLLPPSPNKTLLVQSEHSTTPTHLTNVSLLPDQTGSTPEAIRNISLSVHTAARSHTTTLGTQAKPSKLPVQSGMTRTKIKQLSKNSQKKDPSQSLKPRNDDALRFSSASTLSTVSHSSRHNPQRSGTSTIPSTVSKLRKSQSKTSKRLVLDKSLVKVEHLAVDDTVQDIIADQIAEAVSSQTEDQMLKYPSPITPDVELHSVTDTLSALGQTAFVSKDKIPRTPRTKVDHKEKGSHSKLSPVAESPLPMTTLSPLAESPLPMTTLSPLAESPLPMTTLSSLAESPLPMTTLSPLAESPLPMTTLSSLAESPLTVLNFTFQPSQPFFTPDKPITSISNVSTPSATVSYPQSLQSLETIQEPFTLTTTPSLQTEVTTSTHSHGTTMDLYTSHPETPSSVTTPLLSFQTRSVPAPTRTPATMSLISFETPVHSSHVTSNASHVTSNFSHVPSNYTPSRNHTSSPSIGVHIASQETPTTRTELSSFRTPTSHITSAHVPLSTAHVGGLAVTTPSQYMEPHSSSDTPISVLPSVLTTPSQDNNWFSRMEPPTPCPGEDFSFNASLSEGDAINFDSSFENSEI